MSHTFDIRFARSDGLAGLFEAPANRLGWKGHGELRIDAQGISIAMKRGLLSWFARRGRRFSASSLAEVYREGEALRLEFNTADSREVLPVWTSGSAAAAEIVKLLPTRQTVELEHPAVSQRQPYRLDRRLLVLAVAAAAVLAAIALLVQRSEPVAPAAAPAADASQEIAVERAGDTVARAPMLRLPRTSPVYAVARRLTSDFETDTAELLNQYVALMEAPSPLALDDLAAKWDAKLERVRTQFEREVPELVRLGNMQAGICVNWRDFLRNYAEGLRTRNLDAINAGFAAREQAGLMRDRMRRYVPD